MTREAFEILTHAKIQALLEENLQQDPAEFALSQRDNDLPVALIASQLQSLQKSRFKLPDWYNARCIFPGRALEQASSELTAQMKRYQGETCLDLTAGLGVDSWNFSKSFQQVTSIEQNSDLSTITRYNLQKLGVHNVSVLCSTAKDFLQEYSGNPFDLIYLDPDRRDELGNRKIRLEDCSPNVIEILPYLLRHGRAVLIKLSPLFDLSEARRIFPSASQLIVHSINNECKEVLIELDQAPVTETKIVVHAHRGGENFSYLFSPPIPTPAPISDYPFLQSIYVLEPDVACYKGEVQGALFTQYFPGLEGSCNHPLGYFFTQHPATDFPGRIFRIREIMPYKPSALKKWRKVNQITRLNVSKRHFPMQTAAIRKQLGIQEGGDDFLLCTVLPNGKKYAIWAERV